MLGSIVCVLGLLCKLCGFDCVLQ